jgi:hypothetical protein
MIVLIALFTTLLVIASFLSSYGYIYEAVHGIAEQIKWEAELDPRNGTISIGTMFL